MNDKGYRDPTAETAIRIMVREENRKKKSYVRGEPFAENGERLSDYQEYLDSRADEIIKNIRKREDL